MQEGDTVQAALCAQANTVNIEELQTSTNNVVYLIVSFQPQYHRQPLIRLVYTCPFLISTVKCRVRVPP